MLCEALLPVYVALKKSIIQRNWYNMLKPIRHTSQKTITEKKKKRLVIHEKKYF